MSKKHPFATRAPAQRFPPVGTAPDSIAAAEGYVQIVRARRGRLLRLVAATLVLVIDAPSAAEEGRLEPDWLGRVPPRDRFVLRGGYQWIFGANTTVRVDGEQSGVGATIEWQKTLGGDSTAGSGRLEAYARLFTNHAFEFQWFRARLDGSRATEVDLQIGDEVFVAGAEITSEQRIDVYRFVYSWSFYRSDRVELELSPGLYVAAAQLGFEGNVAVDSGGGPVVTTAGFVGEEVTVPLPSIGIKGSYEVADWLALRMRADFFYLKAREFEGSLTEFTFGPEFRLIEHVGVGLVYDRLNISLQNRDRGGWRFDNSFNALYAYGALYF